MTQASSQHAPELCGTAASGPINEGPAYELFESFGRSDLGERIVGLGHGGSESLVYIIEQGDTRFVRKVSSTAFSAVRWPSTATDVMSDPFRRALHQARFLRELPASMASLFPAVLDFQIASVPPGDARASILDLEFISGNSISDLSFGGQLDKAELRGVCEAIAEILAGVVHPSQTSTREADTVSKMHIAKMRSRLALSNQADWPGIQDASARHITLHGNRMLGIGAALDEITGRPELLAALEPPMLCRVVGDTNTQNIILTGSENFRSPDLPIRERLRFLDPRGIGVGPLHLDDPVYDWKFWHNTLGHYDQIYHGDFEVSSSLERGWLIDYARTPERVTLRRDALEIFPATMNRYCAVAAEHGVVLGEHVYLRFLFLMASHFASMIPFHLSQHGPERPNWKPFAMYCEAVWWMNACLGYWDGAGLADSMKFVNEL